MKVSTDKQKIESILNRGTVSEILPSKEEFEKKLLSGKRLRIYIGADPTSDSLHLGHAANYIFLEELRELGHEIIILIGDFTAQIGDPSERASTRPQLSEEEVKKNEKNWIDQVKPLISFDDKENPAQIKHNSEWLSPLTFKDIARLASNFTVQQMIERDMFERRLKEGTPIHLHEFLYPLMQGYDSVAMDVDVELCGTDQIFNALVGRTLLKRLKNKDKLVVALNLVGNPKTGELMSKSKGTGVLLSSPPNEMYGAIMAQPDEMIETLFVNCTRIPLSEKDSVLALGPRDAKARIAYEVTKKFYGEEQAKSAEEEFVKTFSKGGVPDDLPEIIFEKDLAQNLKDSGIVSSKSDWRRLVDEGAVETEDGKKITDYDFSPETTLILKIGKRRFVKIIV